MPPKAPGWRSTTAANGRPTLPCARGWPPSDGDIKPALDRIHARRYSTADYDALADQIGRRIDDITKNCRLPEAADAQLHIVQIEVMDGVEAMKGKVADRSRGAVGIVKALDRYQAHFDHPGWVAIKH
jgi:hypothetical protein